MQPLACTVMLLLGCTFFSVRPAQTAESDTERQKEIKECETQAAYRNTYADSSTRRENIEFSAIILATTCLDQDNFI